MITERVIVKCDWAVCNDVRSGETREAAIASAQGRGWKLSVPVTGIPPRLLSKTAAAGRADLCGQHAAEVAALAGRNGAAA